MRRLADEGVRLPVAPGTGAAGRHRGAALARRRAPGPAGRGRSPRRRPTSRTSRPTGVVLVLDQITDPHNVGAILRTAAAFAVGGHRHHRAPQPGGDRRAGQIGVRRARTGADRQRAESRARARRAEGARLPRWSGSTATAATISRRSNCSAPLALVLGAEGKGLRQLTRATCDQLARLDLPGAIKSLNVSNAAALALYIATRRVGAQRS